MSFTAKVYVVQKYHRDPLTRKLIPGEVLGMKLTNGAAHELAKAFAPARVIFGIADKTPLPNADPFKRRDR